MTYQVSLRPEAQIEFNQSVDWYEERQRGLGKRFVESIDNAIQFIAESPQLAARVHKEIRCKSVKGFPYQVFYRIQSQNTVEVLSIFHIRQHPAVWQSRR